MVEKVLQYVAASKAQFVKYVVVGGSGVVLDIGTLWILKELLGMGAVMAVVVNQTLLLSYNFLLNKYWSFANRDMPHWQVARYLTLAAFNYAFSVAAMYVFHEMFGWHYLLVRVGSIGVMTLWNFYLYKNWVYRSDVVYKSEM